ncbi:hypothetical protein GEU84_016335 [Fertoebacter nigrum]|uniref:Uncharacterized protein n=1 Tax=Fertoeibacter niger TaxID=2656921 RepID=A0A8X8KS35_9RHOB|nr:hypothetical protein [Fertoeibacter niger]NUB45967.1 hypothetical protein [Fertoeibacter niger]
MKLLIPILAVGLVAGATGWSTPVQAYDGMQFRHFLNGLFVEARGGSARSWNDDDDDGKRKRVVRSRDDDDDDGKRKSKSKSKSRDDDDDDSGRGRGRNDDDD